MTPAEWIMLAGMVVGWFVSIIGVWSGLGKSVNDAKTEMLSTVAKLDGRIAVVEMQIAVFWKGVAKDAAEYLHKPEADAAIMDAMLDRYLSGKMTVDELSALKRALRIQIWSDEPDTGETKLLHALDQIDNPTEVTKPHITGEKEES